MCVCVCVCVCVCETNFLTQNFPSFCVLLGADVTYVNVKHKNNLSNITFFYGTEYSEVTVGQKRYCFTQNYLLMGVIRVDYILY